MSVGTSSLGIGRLVQVDAINGNRGQVRLRRFGPEWLDLLGADRYRRRIAGVEFFLNCGPYEEQADVSDALRATPDILERLSGAPQLEFLLLRSVYGALS